MSSFVMLAILLLSDAAPGGSDDPHPQETVAPWTLLDAEQAVEGRSGQLRRAERVSVLVELKPTADRRAIVDFAAEQGAHCKYEYKLLPHMVNVRDLTDKAVEELERRPDVLHVYPDREVRIHLNDSTAHVRALQSQIFANGLAADGSGVRLCVIDTGIDSNHTMFAARIDAAAGFDFVNGDPDPEDDHGHGTHVSGIALGRTGFDVDFGGGSGLEPLQGMAPNATLIGVKVLGSTGSGSTSDVLAGVDRCADPLLPGGPADVINMSLGCCSYSGTCDQDPMAQAVNAAAAAGVVVVASAGNGAADNALGSPACASQAIAIAATYDDDFPNPDFPTQNSFNFSVCSDPNPRLDALTCFSNRSTQIDVAAPGCLTYSADYGTPSGNDIRGLCGTSMSGPHVAGLAALLLDLDPALSPAGVRQLIRDSAVDLGPPGFDIGYGFGLIDAVAALKLASTCTIPADCDDGLFCNGVETCVSGECETGSPACPGQLCDEAAQSCQACAIDPDCDNGVLCDGLETCDAGVCRTAGLPCPGQFCDAGINACVCLTDADCQDGDPCNGIDVCGGGGICTSSLTDCNDNGVLDLCDVLDATSPDVAPTNGVPDECDALVRFTLDEVPTLGGETGQAMGLNELGQVVGFAETGETSPGGQPITHGFVWDGTTITDLGTLGGENSLADDINENGVIGGWADLAEQLPPPPVFAFKNQPTRWDAGVPTQLNVLGDFTGGVRALNDANTLAGFGHSGFELFFSAILWDPSNQPLKVVNSFGGDSAEIYGINNDGDTVGWMNVQPIVLNRQAFLLLDGAQEAINLGGLGGAWAWALDVNFRKQVVGQASNTAGLFRPFLWEQSGMIDLGSLGGGLARARAINDASQVVGSSTHPDSVSISDTFAFTWQGGTIENLNDLIPSNRGWLLRDAHDVNEAGAIVGFGLNADGLERGFLLTPCGGAGNPCFVPECVSAAECDDAMFCNGAETCPAGFCVAALPPGCDDADPCTLDVCDTVSDGCLNVPLPVPGEARNLGLQRSPGSTVADLSWDAEPGATAYNVYRASDSALGDLVCMLAGVSGTNTPDDGMLPAAGGVFFHLVTSTGCSGESTLGQATGGERLNVAPCAAP